MLCQCYNRALILEEVLEELKVLVEPLLRLCLEAGDAICQHYSSASAGDYHSKSDDSPLTAADLASDAILREGLSLLTPQIPILSEESGEIAFVERQAWERHWLVDPLDGTKEFLSRTGEFTINIALIERHRPVLGVVYLPLERHAYVGIPGDAAYRYTYGDSALAGSADWESEAIATRTLPHTEPFALLASRRHHSATLDWTLQWLEGAFGELVRLDSGSALKFCQLAAGNGDFYPRFSPCCEWDTAAGQALLEAAGGCLLDMEGNSVGYNRQKSLYSPHFIAVGDAQHSYWQEYLAAYRMRALALECKE